ncbi:MAG: elongation factor G [bacterium]
MNDSGVRNVGTIAPKGTGKTTLVEAILYNAGAVEQMGKVVDGNTVSDSDIEEIERQMTLFPAVCSFKWKKSNIHLIDTAGYPDFIGETRALIHNLDNAIMPVSGVDGVRSHAVKLWRYLNEKSLPRFIFLNEMDKENASFDNAWESLKKVLEFGFVPVTIPIVQEKKLTGVIDLIKMKAYTISDTTGGGGREEEIPVEMQEVAEKYREALAETAAEVDDSLTEKYLEGHEISSEEIVKAVRAGTVNAKISPVFSGSALNNIGVSQLLDYFLEFSAAPSERGSVQGKDLQGKEVERKPHQNEPFSAMVLKTTIDQYAGKISIFRVISGVIKPDAIVYNSSTERKEKIGQIFFLCGKKQTSVPSASAGDIVAVVKLQETYSSDTLCDAAYQVVYPRMSLPESVLSIAIRPKERGDEDKLSMGLGRIREEDPLMRLERHEQTKELTVSGMGQLHVDSIVNRLKHRFAVDVEVSTPQVPYRETIRKKVEVQGKYKRQSGGRGQYGDVWLELEPLSRGSGFEFENKIFGGAVPRNYIPAVEKGVVERMSKGVIAGYPIVDMKVTIFDGSYHEVDSSDMAFKIAASMAITKGVQQADPVLLEPVMSIEVEVPDECMGDIIGDLNGRRGRISSIDQGPSVKIIKALVPQAELLRYAPDLRSKTSGRGTYTMELDHFEEVPRKIGAEIIERYERQKKEEEEK